MPLLTCPACRGRIPAAAITCVHCGAMPPVCPDCTGSGNCAACASGNFTLDECKRCSGSGVCAGCQGRKRRWPAPVPGASP